MNQFSAESVADSLPSVDGIQWQTALERFQNDAALLKDTVKSFIHMSLKSEQELSDKMEVLLGSPTPDSFTAFRIQAHAMKNNAATIGASALSDIAKALEYAARDEDSDVIESLCPVFLNKWNLLSLKLKEAFPENTIQKIPLDHTAVSLLLHQLITAAEACDLDTMDETAEALKQYAFAEEEQKLADAIAEASFEIDYDLCSQLATNLLQLLH